MPIPSLTLTRQAAAADVPAIVALVESAYRGESGLRGWTTETHLLDGQRTDADNVAGLIGRDDSRVLLVEREGDLAACCHIERQGQSGYFGMFAVRPELQMAGLGRGLLAEAERIARDEWQAEAMRMSVIEQRAELIAWYQRRGYRLTGETGEFPYGQPRFGIPRRDDLRFVWMSKPLQEVAA
ncbi:GNAT family N-acetyltransferase [Dyella solisilvae]|uniref:GNAT family N-acetyltransferase n=1 Tax=Dyella solisilvae TaxID=1920168 RepID=A0A370KBR6_9GAMM|nr:GNAT family N-acetyltransferase [Dyella solisilvae]RDJ00096.1 GNAT family N-acetyltransferase [Dyella solisilvae]